MPASPLHRNTNRRSNLSDAAGATEQETFPPRGRDRVNHFAWGRLIAHTSRLVLALLCCGGCRSISGFGESHQSLEARKLSRLGLQAIHQGKWDQAENLFTRALAVSETEDRAHRGIAEAYWTRGERDLAIKHMEKAVELSASDPRLARRLGEMYLEENRIQEATQQSELALESLRDSPEVWTLRGDCLRLQNRPEESLAAYHRALSLQPNHTDAKLRVAELYLQGNQYDRLLATLDQYAPVDEESVIPMRVHMLRGIAMRNLQQPDLALKHFVKAARVAPDRAEPLLQIAAIELEKGNTQLASQNVADAMARDHDLVSSTPWAALVEISPHRAAQNHSLGQTPPESTLR